MYFDSQIKYFINILTVSNSYIFYINGVEVSMPVSYFGVGIEVRVS
jgi:hypothetical protein